MGCATGRGNQNHRQATANSHVAVAPIETNQMVTVIQLSTVMATMRGARGFRAKTRATSSGHQTAMMSAGMAEASATQPTTGGAAVRSRTLLVAQRRSIGRTYGSAYKETHT